jgi:hypothetical protein
MAAVVAPGRKREHAQEQTAGHAIHSPTQTTSVSTLPSALSVILL